MMEGNAFLALIGAHKVEIETIGNKTLVFLLSTQTIILADTWSTLAEEQTYHGSDPLKL